MCIDTFPSRQPSKPGDLFLILAEDGFNFERLQKRLCGVDEYCIAWSILGGRWLNILVGALVLAHQMFSFKRFHQ